MSGSNATVSVKFRADLKEFSKSMQNVNRSLKKSGKEMQKIGKNLSLGFTAPFVAFSAVAVKTFAEFEQGMAQVKAVSGATADEFNLLTESALELGRTTRYTAAQVAQLQLNYSKLGFKPDEINKVTAATLELALATGEDLGQSAIVAASTLRGFGLDASEMQRVVDVMAKSFSSSALDLTKFQTAMAAVAPVAKNAGVSIEQATGYLSILVDRGIDASTAGTGLRNIFLDVAKQGITMQDAFLQINTAADSNVKALDLFGKRGATVASIMAQNYLEANKLSEAYKNASGAASSMAAIMDDTLEGSLLKLKSASEGLAISFGEVLAPIVSSFANVLAQLAEKFTQLSPATKQIIVVVGGLVAAIGPLLLTVGFLATNVIPGLITTFGVLKVATIASATAFKTLTTAMLANPIGAIVAAVGALVYAFTAWVQTITPAVSKLKTLWNLMLSGGNAAKFANLQIQDQVEAMIEEEAAAEAAAAAQKKYNEEIANTQKILKTGAPSGVPKAPVVPGGAPKSGSGFAYQFKFAGLSNGISELSSLGDLITVPVNKAGESLDGLQTKLTSFQLAAEEVGSAAGEAFGLLGARIVEGLGLAEDGFQGFIGGLFQTVTKLIAMMLASSLSQSIAGATSSGAATGPAAIFTTPAFIATAVGGVLSAFAAIPKFETGGVVGGSSYYGDKILARVNSQELILNTAQQKRLNSQLNAGGVVQVPYIAETRLSGADLKIVLKRQDKKDSRIS